MARAETLLRESVCVALFASLLLTSCGSAPKVSEPVLRKQALDTEADGVAEAGGGVKVVVAQDGTLERIDAHARKEATPVGNPS